jgi:putative transposase
MPSYPPDANSFQSQQTLAPFLQDEGLPFAEVLSADAIEQAFAEEHVAFGQTSRSLWTPALTLWAFLSQIIGADPSCRQAVARVVVALALSQDLDSLDTASYCRARAKLPASVLRRLALQVGQRLERAAPDTWLWHGRHVQLIDGSTSKLPDTPENQAAFPQPRTQKPGLGFPLIRWVAVVALATAAVQAFAYGPYKGKETSELALLRQVLEHFQPGDVVVADRYYCSYFLVALLRACGVDVVFRLHQRRKYDFRRGRRLGAGDHVVVWQRPARPAWLSVEEYATIPATLEIREIRVTVQEPGSRVREFVVATTLLEAEAYGAAALAELYHQRWQVELDIRSLKTTLQMDKLRCLTPFMIEKEIWAHVLAYNLIRKVAAQAALEGQVTPRSLSFKAVQQVLRGGWQKLTQTTGEEYVRLSRSLLGALRKERVGNRPGRCEPRAVKDRGKPHRRLQEPRAAARAKLLRGKKSTK